MAALVPPTHSARLSRMAVLGLSLVAAGSFAVGVARQLDGAGRSPFPAARGAAARAWAAANAIPEAQPAPALQVAEYEPPAVRHSPPPPPDLTASLPPPPASVPAQPVAAAEAGGADAAASVPEPAAPSPSPAPAAPAAGADLPPTA